MRTTIIVTFTVIFLLSFYLFVRVVAMDEAIYQFRKADDRLIVVEEKVRELCQCEPFDELEACECWAE